MEKRGSRAAGETMSEERRQPEGRMSRAVSETTALADPQPNKSVIKWGVYFLSIFMPIKPMKIPKN